MAATTRERMIEAAEQLLAQRGLYGASFAEVLELTGAARGSVYHYFPGGKDQLVAEALDFSQQRMHDWLEAKRGNTPAEVIAYYFFIWSEMLRRSDFASGCSATAVLAGNASAELSAHAARQFTANQAQLADLLLAGGFDADLAPNFASLLVASAEGAVLLGRGARSLAPLESVKEQLIAQAEHARA